MKDKYCLIYQEDNFFESIYKELYHPIYVFTLKYVMSPNLAHDLTQDVFLKVWERKNRLKDMEKVNSYIYRIAKNHTLDYLRKVKTSKAAQAEILEFYSSSENHKPIEAKIIEEEYFEFMELVLKGMSSRRKQIFVMCRVEGMSYKEVAENLGVSRDTVKYHMVESMRILRGRFVKRFNFKDSIQSIF